MFTNYYQSYRDRIYTHFVYRTGDTATAEDLASTTFLKAYEAWPRYDDSRGAFSTWIYTIAHRVLIDHHRQSGREVPTDFTDTDTIEPFSDEDMTLTFDRDLVLAHAHEAIEQLSPIAARCVTYRYVDDLSIPEIATLTEITEPAIRQHLSRGIKRIKTYLATEYNYHTL